MSTLTHPLQNLFKRIMTDALEDHEGIVPIGGRTITNLRFADDIDGSPGEEEEPTTLVERLDKAFTVYSAEMAELMTSMAQKERKKNRQN